LESELLEPSGGSITARNLSDDLGRPNFSPETDLFVAESDGKLLGCLSVTLEHQIKRALLDALVHPLHRRKGIATELFSSGLQRISKSGIRAAQVSVLESSAAARAFLTHLEFVFIRYFHNMRMEMKNLRTTEEKQGRTNTRRLKFGEEGLLTALQNRCFGDTWGFNPNTEEEIAYRLNMHGRSPEDVTVTFIEDHPVGYCWIIIDAVENAKLNKSKALIHMLGVDPDYRQQEIGKVILHNGLEDLKARGVDTVELTVDSKNPAACSLYESAGFESYAKTEWYEKIV
jgi:mycothiol synthase